MRHSLAEGRFSIAVRCVMHVSSSFDQRSSKQRPYSGRGSRLAYRDRHQVHVPALRTSAAFAPHSLKLVEEWDFVLRTAGTYACHLRGQNLANAVSALLHPEHGTLYCYISIRQPSADNSSSLGSKLISSNAPTYDFYLRELLRSELTYLPYFI